MKPRTLHWIKVTLAVFIICAAIIAAAASIIAAFHPFGIWCPSFTYLDDMACELCTKTCRPIMYVSAP